VTAAARARLPVAAGAGCLLALAVTVAAVWQADETATSPIFPDSAWLDPYRIAVVAAFALYAGGAWAVRRYGAPLGAVVAVAVVVQLAPLAAPQLFSRDAYGYWAWGRVAAVHDGNPYLDLPSRWPDDPAYAEMGAQWRNSISAYGPLWTLTSQGVAQVSGDSADTAAWVFKTLGALGVLALIGAAVWAARDRPFAAAFVGWNPVLALHFAGGGHNDALMMAFPVAGVALARYGRRDLAAAAWAAGIFVKWLPLLLLPLVVARDRVRFGWRGFLLAMAGLSALSFALYGIEWLGAASPISGQLRRASSTSIPFYVERYLDLPQFRVTQVLSLVFAAAYVVLLRQAWHGRARLGLTAGLFCLALSWLPPWYVAWPVSFAAIEEDRAARLLALGLTAWLLRDAIPLP
jgi:hypothetical protein